MMAELTPGLAAISYTVVLYAIGVYLPNKLLMSPQYLILAFGQEVG